MRVRTVRVYRDAAFLSRCSASEARDWLRSRPVTYSNVTGTPNTPDDSHLLEYILYRRNLPLIDLALAENGRSGLILGRIYQRGTAATRVIACGNPSLFVGSTSLGPSLFSGGNAALLWDIVQEGPLSELRAICECPDLTSGFFFSLITAWEGCLGSQVSPENRLPDDRFRCVLCYLAGNPRISIPRNQSRERHYIDGFASHQYDGLSVLSWMFAEYVPVEPEWAEVLATLYHKLYRPFDVFDDIEKVLQRWRPENEHRSAPTAALREELAAKFMTPTIEALESKDPAIRRAFYRTFDPDEREFEQLDWVEWLERDDLCYLYLRNNYTIWRSPN